MEKTYTAEFIIHDGVTSLPYIAHPSITIRFLQFPSIAIDGSFQGRLVFSKGKSCKFSLRPNELSESLLSFPLYILLSDSSSSNIRLLGTSALDLSVFASQIPLHPEFKRNIVELRDPVKNIIAKLDMSISISELVEEIPEKADQIFQNINYEPISQPFPGQVEDKSTGTDPIIQPKPQKNQETNTEAIIKADFEYFGDNLQPPPMFFAKARKKN